MSTDDRGRGSVTFCASSKLQESGDACTCPAEPLCIVDYSAEKLSLTSAEGSLASRRASCTYHDPSENQATTGIVLDPSSALATGVVLAVDVNRSYYTTVRYTYIASASASASRTPGLQ